MYQPHHFRVDDVVRQAELVRAYPLGLLVTAGANGLVANPIPFVLDAQPDSLGVLRCHLARANPQWRDIHPGMECLVVFKGRDFYVTPSWYATKAETGKAVPTWNYVTVHAWGVARVVEDDAWLHSQIRDLTDQHELPRAEPWAVDDAPESYVAAQVKGVVGLEITVTRSEGKWKLNQNHPERNRAGVRQGLLKDGDAEAAELIE